jgi:ABC-type transport system substrate-binding protein
MSFAKIFAIVLGLVLALVLALFSAAQAQEAFVGSWVLDPASSKAPPGIAATSGTLEITAAGDGKYTSVSEATVAGTTGRSEITFSVDGKDYAVTTTPAQPGTTITQSLARESATVYKSDLKLNGQLIATAVTEISSDGKTLTQTSTGVGQFAALSGTSVFKRK